MRPGFALTTPPPGGAAGLPVSFEGMMLLTAGRTAVVALLRAPTFCAAALPRCAPPCTLVPALPGAAAACAGCSSAGCVAMHRCAIIWRSVSPPGSASACAAAAPRTAPAAFLLAAGAAAMLALRAAPAPACSEPPCTLPDCAVLRPGSVPPTALAGALPLLARRGRLLSGCCSLAAAARAALPPRPVIAHARRLPLLPLAGPAAAALRPSDTNSLS